MALGPAWYVIMVKHIDALKEIRMGPGKGQQVPGLRGARKPLTPRCDMGQG